MKEIIKQSTSLKQMYPSEVHLYMVAVRRPSGLKLGQRAENARKVDEKNAELALIFKDAAKRAGYGEDEFHIHAHKGAPFFLIAAREMLMENLQETQGQHITQIRRCVRQGSSLFFRNPFRPKIVPEYLN